MSPAQGAGAASVVEYLLAFLKEPARHRAASLHGAAGLDGGHHILKFALGKFPDALARHLAPERRRELHDAAIAFLREVCFHEGATYYQVLCARPDAKREAIKENYHLLMALIHPDRSESSAQAWPADWAQRANRAYTVLSDDASRASYDRSLRVVDSIPPYSRRVNRPRSVRMRGGAVARAIRFGKAAAALGAVIVVLLLVQAWIGDVLAPNLFDPRSMGRDAGIGAERPRFLGSGMLPAAVDASRDAFSRAEGTDPLVAPMWRSHYLAPESVSPAGKPDSPAPAPAPETAASNVAASARLETPAPPEEAMGMQQGVQSAVASAPREGGLTAEQIEIVVARLITYYEDGDADRLIALIDASAGELARMRQVYQDFFRATRERRLRVKSLDWQGGALAARARGQATVEAEYVNGLPRLDRDIDVAVDIALRNGQARITRLSVFPNVP